MKTVILIIFLLASKIIYAQDTIKYWNKDQPLQWADFKAPVDESSIFYAKSFTGMHYDYHRHSLNGEYTLTFKTASLMYINLSWAITEKETEFLLKHEQIHFDISEYFARQLLVALNKQTYSADYKNEIIAICQRIENERATMQAIYDEQTNHSLNKKAQAKWNTFVNDILTNDSPLGDVVTKERSVK